MQKKKKPYRFELNYTQYYFIVQIVLSRNNLYDLLNFISVREVYFSFSVYVLVINVSLITC